MLRRVARAEDSSRPKSSASRCFGSRFFYGGFRKAPSPRSPRLTPKRLAFGSDSPKPKHVLRTVLGFGSRAMGPRPCLR